MNNFIKGLRSVAVTALLVAALPLGASAMTIGVSNSLDSTILSGHVCQTQSAYSLHNGTEWTNSTAVKYETGTVNGAANAYTVDPAATNSTTNGNYVAVASSNGGTYGTYSSGSSFTSTLSGGSEQQTSLTHSVSTFANP